MSPATDSAGQPFHGRSFSPQPFAGDTGEADPVLLAALENSHALVPGVGTPAVEVLEAAWCSVVERLRSARVLIPLIAQAGDVGLTAEGKTVEKTQELSVIHVEGPDGRAVAPIFSSTETMSAWNPQARPIPVQAARAALAAGADGLELVVLDPGNKYSVVLRRSALSSIATGLPYIPPWSNPEVLGAIANALLLASSDVVSHRVVPGDPGQQLAGPEVTVELALRPGLNGVELEAVVSSITTALSGSEIISAAADGMGLTILQA
jgi:hypothetical protein